MSWLNWLKPECEDKNNNNIIEAKLPVIHDQDAKLDIYSPTWIFVSGWVSEELEKTRERNDYMKNDATKTAALRGRIKLLKEILILPEKNK